MTRLLIFLTLVFCCFFVSINELTYIPLFFSVLLFLLSLLKIPFVDLNKRLIYFLLFLNAPFLISLFSLTINVFFNNDFLLYSYIQPFGRISNMVVYISLIIFFDYLIRTNSKTLNAYDLLKYYYYSCFIFLGSVIWQFLYFKFDFPIKFPIETRSFVHGSALTEVLSNRITGLAQEPSYTASFLTEFVILSIFLIKNKYFKFLFVFIAILMSYYTYSPSVYISLGFVLLAYILMVYGLLKIIVITLSVFTFSLFVIDFSRIYSILYVYDRIDNAGDSGRFKHIFHVLNIFVSESNFFTLMFGHGLKSYTLIGTIPGNEYVLPTSNNIFIDYLFEAGVIGVLFLIFFLFKCIVMIYKCPFKEQKIFAILFFIEAFTTSLIKAEYASFRFLMAFYFIYVFTNYKIVKN